MSSPEPSNPAYRHKTFWDEVGETILWLIVMFVVGYLFTEIMDVLHVHPTPIDASADYE